ncbi:hypothetical protein C2S52_006383 [Perilla frutescens var. hirtella]|nr:hypothetical protein C2S51_009421 [Perilla frutescens var. frutescens]KAH6786831.1 hypothetical protein C2S52_006383 [Perilla frutescens var. hirtella]
MKNVYMYAHTTHKYAGWLQSLYGLHTFRVESIAHGKAAPVDELQIQGVSNPRLLRKVIVTQASKAIQDTSISWNPNFKISSSGSMFRMESLTLGPAVLRSPVPKSTKLHDFEQAYGESAEGRGHQTYV